VIVVVAEDGHHGDRRLLELPGERSGLVGVAVLSQVARQQEHVGTPCQPLQLRRRETGGIPADVDIADRGDPDQPRYSWSVGSR
jgi:hypothetical protein